MEDSNIARRNLMFMSMAIIAYLYAGGQLADGKLTFQIISLQFEAQEKLAHLAWALFFWFWLRYYQLSARLLSVDLKSDLNLKKYSPFVLWLARKTIKLTKKINEESILRFDKNEPTSVQLYCDDDYRWYYHITNYREYGEGISCLVDDDDRRWILSPAIGLVIYFIIRLYTAFHGKAFALYMMPHIVAGTAFMAGAAGLIQEIISKF